MSPFSRSIVRPTIRLSACSGASNRSIFDVDEATTRTVTKELMRKIAAIQLTIVEYRPGNVPIAGGASVSRHHERVGEDWGKGVTISSMWIGL